MYLMHWKLCNDMVFILVQYSLFYFINIFILVLNVILIFFPS